MCVYVYSSIVEPSCFCVLGVVGAPFPSLSCHHLVLAPLALRQSKTAGGVVGVDGMGKSLIEAGPFWRVTRKI